MEHEEYCEIELIDNVNHNIINKLIAAEKYMQQRMKEGYENYISQPWRKYSTFHNITIKLGLLKQKFEDITILPNVMTIEMYDYTYDVYNVISDNIKLIVYLYKSKK